MANLLFHHAALLAPSASSTSGLDVQSVNGLVSVLLDLNDRGYALAGAVLGLCLLPLGSLAYRSSRLPRRMTLGTAVLLEAPDAAGAIDAFGPGRYAAVEVHRWRFGGRPS